VRARNLLLIVAGVTIVYFAVIVLVVMLTSGEAQAHERWVYLHNYNDAGAAASGHERLIACDGTSNGHHFGVQGRTASGNTYTIYDVGSGAGCNSNNPGGHGAFTQIRWVCHGSVGSWRAT
jgi:hypothetical protein